MSEYQERDLMELDKVGNYYGKHVLAMTREDLRSKSDIAAELGYRDMVIDKLAEENKRLRQMLKCAVKVANDPNATYTAIQILNIESQYLLSELGGE
ncbi:hypothetical protein AAEX90_001859 [Vibrio cholerae]